MHILIHGSSIAGTTLATLLAHSSSTHARSTMTLLEHAGPALLPHGRNVNMTGTAFVDARGRAFARIPGQRGASASLSFEFEILRGDLARIRARQRGARV
jgi:2-polyprenyl-6-methoxyphenol hydroxylase-like FAD-dependent oxidoreductase